MSNPITQTSFYSREELESLGFGSVGKDVKISRFARFYGISNIHIGDNVRIDDFCIISGHVQIGSHIHISAYAALYGSQGIILEDYSGVSPRSTIYSAMDDFSGDYLIGPIHEESLTNVKGGTVRVCRFAQIGCNSVVFPDLTIGEGVVLGAMSFVKSDLKPWGVYAGAPCRRISDRKKGVLKLILEK